MIKYELPLSDYFGTIQEYVEGKHRNIFFKKTTIGKFVVNCDCTLAIVNLQQNYRLDIN